MGINFGKRRDEPVDPIQAGLQRAKEYTQPWAQPQSFQQPPLQQPQDESRLPPVQAVQQPVEERKPEVPSAEESLYVISAVLADLRDVMLADFEKKYPEDEKEDKKKK